MNIQLEKLPKNILDQIPISIKTTKSTYNINELPEKIKYLINKYYSEARKDISYSNNVFDISPIIDKYNDFIVLNKKFAVIEYFKNYLQIYKSAYPYDVSFGCKLKEYLQTRDTSLQETEISVELNNMINVLTNDYNISIIINSTEIIHNPQHIFTEYMLRINLTIENENFEINV